MRDHNLADQFRGNRRGHSRIDLEGSADVKLYSYEQLGLGMRWAAQMALESNEMMNEGASPNHIEAHILKAAAHVPDAIPHIKGILEEVVEHRKREGK